MINHKEEMANKEKLRNMKRKMYRNLEGFLKDWEDYIKEQVEHKHQVSMQCARDGIKETCIEIIENRIKWQKDLIEQAEGKENIINTCECVIHQLEVIIKMIKEKE